MPDLLLFEIKKSLRGSKELAVCKAAATAAPPTIEPRLIGVSSARRLRARNTANDLRGRFVLE